MRRRGAPLTAGFTLVELLAVLFIIGLTISIVGVGVVGSESLKLRNQARDFANRTALSAEEAVLANRQRGVDFFRIREGGEERLGYRWLVQGEERRWYLADDSRAPVQYLFDEGVELQLQLEGRDEDELIEMQQVVEPLPLDTAVPGTTEPTPSERDANTIIAEDGSIVDREPVEPELWLLSSGEMTPFILTLWLPDEDDLYADRAVEVRVEGDELGRIKLLGDDDEAGAAAF